MVNGLGGRHLGLMAAMIAMSGVGVLEPCRPELAADRDIEPVDRESMPPAPKPKRLATPPQLTASDQLAMTAAAEKRARKNARRLSVTEAA